jgi:hypothetical protein
VWGQGNELIYWKDRDRNHWHFYTVLHAMSVQQHSGIFKVNKYISKNISKLMWPQPRSFKTSAYIKYWRFTKFSGFTSYLCGENTVIYSQRDLPFVYFNRNPSHHLTNLPYLFVYVFVVPLRTVTVRLNTGDHIYGWQWKINCNECEISP